MALVSVVGASGCAPDYVTSSTAPVLLLIGAINGGAVLESDVLVFADPTSPPVICTDTVEVALAVRSKNPQTTTIAVPEHVLVQQYEVRYFRTDGRGTEGLDVPYAYRGALASEVDLATSGTTSVPIPVVRAHAKLEPPLSNITGLQIVTMIAEITVRGQTVAGQAVVATGRLQIDFADWGLTACAAV